MYSTNLREKISGHLKRLATLALAILAIGLLPPTAQAVGETGSLSGQIGDGKTERGMQVMGDEDTGQGIGWDMMAPKNKAIDHAIVWLIADDLDASKLSEAEVNAWYQDGIVPAGLYAYITETDNKGGYSFDNVPCGRYYLVVLSSQPVEEGSASAYAELQHILPSWEKFELYAIGVKSCAVKRVNVLQ